ncbi:MAG: OsmC family protein [Tissierellia bacterium]|nr:OsmC family protein [Tissierellia bacterium]
MYKSNVSGKLKEHMAFEIDIDGHTIITDASVEDGGSNLGPSPKALLLAGLIGCSGIDIMSIIKKMKLELDDVNVDVEAEIREEAPNIYNYIKIVYKFKGKNIPYNKVERAVRLSMEKYCGVAAMLENAVPITYEVVVEE